MKCSMRAFKHAKTLANTFATHKQVGNGNESVEAAYHANSPVEELMTINNWGDASNNTKMHP